ncbi:hypothetical protein, partial [Sulfitobacter pontiacus]|uniref:hypothetical protein n=1 Tax=Sulfitobacter pontiacus TaxID=60137 RepID=UPI0030EB4E7E
PAAFTIGCGKYFDLRTIDKVGHKLGLTIGLSLRSDGHRRRFTLNHLYLHVVLLVLAIKAASGRAVTAVDKGPRVATDAVYCSTGAKLD